MQFDEVVASAKRANLLQYGYLAAFNYLELVDVVPLWKQTFVLRQFVMVLAQWYALAYASHNALAQYFG